MSPEYKGSNLWELLPEEQITGAEGRVFKGPALIRVHQFPNLEGLGIQWGDKFLEVEGTNLLDVIQQVKK